MSQVNPNEPIVVPDDANVQYVQQPVQYVQAPAVQYAPAPVEPPKKKKKTWLWALLGFLVLFGIIRACSGGTNETAPPATTPAVTAPGETAAPAEPAPAPAANLGTRDNPYPIGTELESNDGNWTVVINSVERVEEDSFGQAPEHEGDTFILINLTATYHGDEADGAMPWVQVQFVTSGGNTIGLLDGSTFAIAPDAFDSTARLFSGASTSGNIILEVPDDDVEHGVLRVDPNTLDFSGRAVFVATH